MHRPGVEIIETWHGSGEAQDQKETRQGNRTGFNRRGLQGRRKIPWKFRWEDFSKFLGISLKTEPANSAKLI